MTKPYFGRLLTAMVTPCNEDGSINYAAGADFAEWLLANGSDGLVVEGSTGEAATMNMDEKIKFMETIVKRVNGRAKIVAGAGTNCTASTIELAQKMEACGADGLLVVGPYYNKPTQEGYYQHFAAVAGYQAADYRVQRSWSYRRQYCSGNYCASGEGFQQHRGC